MMNRYMDGDAAANLLERRWFAAFKAASGVRAECEALLESLALTQAAWNDARARLSELEVLRDALGEELEALDDREEPLRAEDSSEVMSAA
jgi:predicted nuclease with TOPRIM domain